MRFIATIIAVFALLLSCSDNTKVKSESMEKEERLRALIIDGENNHGVFPKTTMMMKDYLEESGVFTVDIYRSKNIWQGPHHNKVEGVDSIKQLLTLYPLNDGVKRTSVDEPVADTTFNPDFKKYDLVVSNFGWKASAWPDQVKKNFETFVSSGGGFVLTHAADNSWGDWEEYNKMIGLGGWGGRNTASGPYVYYDNEGVLQYDKSEGNCGSHGPQSEFQVETRASDHPIMKGLPRKWMHTKDELYSQLRGPAENLTVLATAFAGEKDSEGNVQENAKLTNRNEPVLMAIEYGKGRVFHSILGHMDYSLESVGFMATFQRGAEWAATGQVTQKVPKDFPSEDKSSARKWMK